MIRTRDPPNMGGFGTFGVNRLQRTELAYRARACRCRLHPSGRERCWARCLVPAHSSRADQVELGTGVHACKATKLGSLVGLSRGQHAKLAAIGIGHGHPAGLALADVDASCPQRDQTVDLVLQITVDGWSEVEM